MDRKRSLMLSVIFAFVIVFTVGSAGCSAPADTSQSPTVTPEISPSPCPSMSPTATGDLGSWQANAFIDGQNVDITTGSVIGQGKVELGHWRYPPSHVGGRNTNTRTILDPETGLAYVIVEFVDCNGNLIKPDKIMDYFENYGVDHTYPSPTPTPSVWLTGIEISPSYLKDSIDVGETVQFTA
ncbi:hypothetical protein ACFLTL_01765, partial [Chloroflexota bacterium]